MARSGSRRGCRSSACRRAAGRAACSSGNACASRTASCTAYACCCEDDADHGRRLVGYEMRRTRLPVPTISKVSLSTTLSEPPPSATRYCHGHWTPFGVSCVRALRAGHIMARRDGERLEEPLSPFGSGSGSRLQRQQLDSPYQRICCARDGSDRKGAESDIRPCSCATGVGSCSSERGM